MDRTLKRVTYRNRRRIQRNWKAWQLFSPDGETCRFCPHGAADHLTSSGQPHFYRPATEAERRDPSVTLCYYTLPEGGSILVKRMIVANRAELITAYCAACAESMGTSQVLCFQRNLAIGELIGLQANDLDIEVAA